MKATLVLKFPPVSVGVSNLGALITPAGALLRLTVHVLTLNWLSRSVDIRSAAAS